jgi:hypothetical protein
MTAMALTGKPKPINVYPPRLGAKTSRQNSSTKIFGAIPGHFCRFLSGSGAILEQLRKVVWNPVPIIIRRHTPLK